VLEGALEDELDTHLGYARHDPAGPDGGNSRNGHRDKTVLTRLAEIYGAEVTRDTISTITDRVLESLAEWQSRPLDAVYAVLFIDVINVKIRDGQVGQAQAVDEDVGDELGVPLDVGESQR
jgi:putative transposase